jgi:hypothetical protein
MSPDELPTTTPDTSDVRFGMRAVLVLMALTAVGATVLGAFLRQFPSQVQPRLWIYWSVFLALVGGVLLISARRRYLAERKAGRVLLRLAPHSYALPHAPRFVRLSMGIMMLTWAPIMWVIGTFELGQPGAIPWRQIADFPTAYSLAIFGAGLGFFWWAQSIRVSENSVVDRSEFLSWELCREWRWDICYPHVAVLEFEKHQSVLAVVPTELRIEIAKLLQEKVGCPGPKKAPRASSGAN